MDPNSNRSERWRRRAASASFRIAFLATLVALALLIAMPERPLRDAPEPGPAAAH